MSLSYAPLKVLGPPATLLGLAGAAKLVYDMIDKSFRVGTNTLVVLGVAGLLMVTGLVADLVVQLNRPRHDVLPATAVDRVT